MSALFIIFRLLVYKVSRYRRCSLTNGYIIGATEYRVNQLCQLCVRFMSCILATSQAADRSACGLGQERMYLKTPASTG